MGGKPKSAGPTREGWRFHWLILQLHKEGMSGAELARLTGTTEAHINAFKNIQSTGKSGIGAEIIRKMKVGLGLDPDYFFDDYEGERPYKLYLLANRRDQKRDERVDELTSIVQRMQERIELLEAGVTRETHPLKAARAKKA